MWKSKTAPILVSLAVIFQFLGCLSIEPTYTKEKIVEHITTLCQQEYKVEPKVWLLGETVLIYIPLPRLITKEVKWDKDTMEKINKVMMGACRVLLSMKPRPKFMELIASDTKEYGIDYSIITWIPDIVKYQLQFISRDEFSRRNVIKIKENSKALSDAEGNHIEKKEIVLEDFLAEQISQRIYLKFGPDSPLKDYFKVKGVVAKFDQDTFAIQADIEEIKEPPKVHYNIQKEIAKIVAYVVKEYEFKDFLLVDIDNTATGEESVFSRLALKDFLRKE